jgi:acetyl esterase/lipase
VEEARYFANELRETSNAPVVYAELGGAQHAFDLFCSPRTSHMLVAVLQFLDATHANAQPWRAEQTKPQDPQYERHLAVRV